MGVPLQHEMVFGVFHLFCGSGGGALGFQRATREWRGIRGRFRTLGGVDCDPEACQDFEMLTGVPATCLDLFSREDYVAFHGHEPPAGWREATPEDLRAAAGWERPDVVFSSPPCKGFSALLPKARAQTPKYEALNRLTLRGIWLVLEAWSDDPPGLIILENVPRITSRGRELLRQIHALLRSYGYAVHDGYHDVGEVGGLAQHRRRYLLVARHTEKVPAFLYRPPRRRVRAIGEVLEKLPLPDDPAAGPMHQLPRLSWLTWLRLALIPAGGDWRDLQRIDPSTVGLQRWRGHFRVVRWGEPARTVTGQSASYGSNSAMAVADPRIGYEPHDGAYRVGAWDRPAGTVIGRASVRGSNGMAAVADPRLPDHSGCHHSKYRVEIWVEQAHTVTGSDRIGSGAPAVADPHLRRAGALGITPWDEPSGAVIGETWPSNGRYAVADPRLPREHGRNYKDSPGLLGMQRWDESSAAITGSASVSGNNTPAAVADLRLGCTPRSGAYRIVRWDETAPTVTGAGDVHAQGAAAVADPRLPTSNEQGVWVIVAEDGTWHRPLTTLELAALQGFPTRLPDGRALVLAGRSHARWRERIGNAVPPPAAEAIAEMMLLALMPARLGVWILSPLGTALWVRWLLERVKRFRGTGARFML